MDGQCYVDTEDRTLPEIHEISPHDPLTAKLHIEIRSPPLYLMCLNIKKHSTWVADEIVAHCQNLNPKPDLYMFHNLTKNIT